MFNESDVNNFVPQMKRNNSEFSLNKIFHSKFVPVVGPINDHTAFEMKFLETITMILP